MISPRLCFKDIDPHHWARLVNLLLPPPGGDPPIYSNAGPFSFLSNLAKVPVSEKRSTTALSSAMPVIALHKQGRVERLFQLGGGTLDPSILVATDQAALKAFRKKHRLPFIAAVDLEVLPTLYADLQSCVNLEDDYAAQQLSMLKVFREALGQGVIVDPKIFGSFPFPSYKLLQMTFDRLLPDRKSFVFYIIEQGRVWCSLIAVKQKGDLQLISTHAAIADKVHFGSMSDAHAVIQTITEEIAPPHVGLFISRKVWYELVAGDRAAIARALTSRKAVLDPAPAWLLALVGVGAVAEGVNRGGRLASHLLSASKLGAQFLPGKTAEKVMKTLANPLEAIGLDPWEFLRWGRDWRRRIELDRERLEGSHE